MPICIFLTSGGALNSKRKQNIHKLPGCSQENWGDATGVTGRGCRRGGGEGGGEEEEEVLGEASRRHCVSASRTSFTSMVPISIFSQLTVSWAAPSALVTTVISTRLPLVTVLPANLWTGATGGGGGGTGAGALSWQC